jgi:uncharacterized protein YbaR (Trm112 family)
MKWYFMDVLACPVCKSYGQDLLLYPIEVVEEDVNVDIEKLRCRSYCAYKNTNPSEVPISVCMECARKRIVTGVIICMKCGRWYPILDSIPVMLDDEYRDMKVYKLFAKKYLEKIPSNIRKLMKNPPLESLI